ncbi:MAG: viral aspartic protease [Paracoccaceae bacterium]|nr:MAG: viral aspartic protease [Paracoccaceae bacterium]
MAKPAHSDRAVPRRGAFSGDRAGRARLAVVLAFALAGCGGGAGGVPTGVDVNTPAFESYTTNHNGYSRVRLDRSTPADAPVIAQFEDSDPASPAGYRELIALSDPAYTGRMTIEVIAQVDPANGDKATRILRLTADQEPLQNISGGRLVTSSGKFFLRGQNFAWVTINGGPLLSGNQTAGGLVDLVLDFDSASADINLRTGVSGASEVRTEVTGTRLPFNIVTGAYGGDVTVQIWDPGSSLIFGIDGALRGSVGGAPVYSGPTHGMTTSGLYTATGIDGGTAVSVDGVFYGTDPNALP